MTEENKRKISLSKSLLFETRESKN